MNQKEGKNRKRTNRTNRKQNDDRYKTNYINKWSEQSNQKMEIWIG